MTQTRRMRHSPPTPHQIAKSHHIAVSRSQLVSSVIRHRSSDLQVIKRIAYSYRNFDYFFLEVRAQYQPTPH